MSADDLFALVAVAVVLTAVGVAAVLLRRSGQKRFERLAPAFDFGTSRKVGFFGTKIEGLYGGYPCRYTIQPASQHNPGGAVLRFSVSAADRWSAEVATAGSRFMVKMGILKDLEIGDPEFDHKLRFSADDEGALRSLFAVDAVRGAFRVLQATENFAGLGLQPNRLDARWSPRAARLDEDAEILRQRLEATAGLVTASGYPPQMTF